MLKKIKKKDLWKSNREREIIGEGEKSQKTRQEEVGEEEKKTEGTGHEGEFGSEARSVATGHKGGSFQETCMRKTKQKDCRRKTQTDLMVAIQKPANCLHGCLWESQLPITTDDNAHTFRSKSYRKGHNTWSWNPHSTWLYTASPCTGTGASRLCRQDERWSGKHEDKIIFNALFKPSNNNTFNKFLLAPYFRLSEILWEAPLNQDKTSNLQRRPHIMLLPELWWAVKATQKKGLGPIGLSSTQGSDVDPRQCALENTMETVCPTALLWVAYPSSFKSR